MQVMKAFYLKGNAFVAIKRINVFEKVHLLQQIGLSADLLLTLSTGLASTGQATSNDE